MDTVMVHVCCSRDEVDEVPKLKLDQILEDQDGSGEARHMRRKMDETHMKTQGNVKSKLEKYLEPLIHVPLQEKYHWWLDLILDPHCVNELTDVRELHGI